MSKKIKITGDDIFRYSEQWVNQENWTDLNVIHSMSIVMGMELVSHWLVDAGCIDPSDSYEPEIETEIVKLAKSFRKKSKKAQDKYYSMAFSECTLFTCEDCDQTSFVHDGNDGLYEEELKECWECHSKNVSKSRWGK